ncbi:uncharacterized protein LOC131327862 [Rhododendron vialii]|uniref:uncharacterized protein LOC131327862 n=1 Tax=Rhododendron vialii TaxID=182163 RepID=UPI00265F93B3|nr:uncharacterized protein LOC131327862 [Rhododendron vialii]
MAISPHAMDIHPARPYGSGVYPNFLPIVAGMLRFKEKPLGLHLPLFDRSSSTTDRRDESPSELPPFEALRALSLYLYLPSLPLPHLPPCIHVSQNLPSIHHHQPNTSRHRIASSSAAPVLSITAPPLQPKFGLPRVRLGIDVWSCLQAKLTYLGMICRLKLSNEVRTKILPEGLQTQENSALTSTSMSLNEGD